MSTCVTVLVAKDLLNFEVVGIAEEPLHSVTLPRQFDKFVTWCDKNSEKIR